MPAPAVVSLIACAWDVRFFCKESFSMHSWNVWLGATGNVHGEKGFLSMERSFITAHLLLKPQTDHNVLRDSMGGGLVTTLPMESKCISVF